MAQHDMAQHDMAQHDMAQHDMTQHDMTQHWVDVQQLRITYPSCQTTKQFSFCRPAWHDNVQPYG
jgi:hypothetical protein